MKHLKPLAFSLSWLCLCGPLGAEETSVRKLFADGYAVYLKKNFEEAAELFKATLERQSPLEDYSLYYLGDMALARGENDRALEHFGRLSRRFPQSTWALAAELGSARALLAGQNYAAAADRLRRILDRSGQGEIFAEAMLELARVQELQGDSTEAYATYQRVRQHSPLSTWAAKAREEVKRLRGDKPQEFAPSTVEALTEEASLLYRERQLGEAAETYREAISRLARGDERAQALKKLAQVFLDARRRDDAMSALSEILRDYADSPEAAEALYHLGRIYWNRDENIKALEHFHQLKERYPQSSFSDFAHFAAARIHESLGKTGEARRLYQSFAKKHPKSPLRHEVAWALGWLLYRGADYAGAHEVFKNLAQAEGPSPYKTGALYWQGRTAERLDRAAEAKGAFSRIADSPEESYYQGLAAKRLARMGVEASGPAGESENAEPNPAPSLGPAGQFHLERARELSDLSLPELALRELEAIRDLAGQDMAVGLFLVREYARNGAFDRSVALAHQLSDRGGDLRRYRYPLAYWEPIRKMAEASGLDPYLVVALIRQESLFDPRAVSPASAHGLMQLLPATAARVSRWLSLEPVNTERLYEPQLNIRLGIRYLEELTRMFPDSLPKAIAAYNAGENAVARWERFIAVQDEEEFIERIPYAETRLYVKLVLRNHRIYRTLYNNLP